MKFWETNFGKQIIIIIFYRIDWIFKLIRLLGFLFIISFTIEFVIENPYDFITEVWRNGNGSENFIIFIKREFILILYIVILLGLYFTSLILNNLNFIEKIISDYKKVNNICFKCDKVISKSDYGCNCYSNF